MLLLMYQPSYWCVSILLESCALRTASNDVYTTLNLKIIHLAEVLMLYEVPTPTLSVRLDL